MKATKLNGTQGDLTVRGYLQTLPKATIMTSSAKEIMNSAPGSLPKKQGTWGQAVSNLRGEYRKGKEKKVEGQTTSPTSTASPTLPTNIKERLLGAINEEVTRVIAEAQAYQSSWQKILGE